MIFRRPTVPPQEFHGISTISPEMKAFLPRITKVARADCTVLVRGESGSGKELTARAIHELSPRAARPFRAVNCAGFSTSLLESRLFGHVRGAFTGAISDRPGLLALADGGTLFLDEIGEMPLDIQSRLLRVLEDKTFTPVGGSRTQTVDVRLVSATNKALRREAAAGRFRSDLMYRIRVVPLFLPPLRDRSGDVEALTWLFIDRLGRDQRRRVDGVRDDAMSALRSYPWPGNVRELSNVIEHAFVMGEGPIIEVDDLTPELRGEPPPGDPTTSLGEFERDARARLLEAMRRHGGHRDSVAADLGISRSTLWRRLKALSTTSL